MRVANAPLWLMRQSVTIYNKSPDSVIENGGYVDKYALTVLDNVRYIQQEGANIMASGGNVADSLVLYIFPELLSTSKRYVTPHEYNTALEADRGNMWTVQKGCDYIALGVQDSVNPSFEGVKNRNDYKISTVDVHYNPDGTLNHIKVCAK